MVAWSILAVAVWPLPAAGHRDLLPYPDAPEYLAMAQSIADGQGTTIEIAGQRHPSRYPPGYSAWIALWLACGTEPIRAPFVASACSAALLLLLVGLGAWRLGSGMAGAIAVMVLVTTPGFLVLARAPLSEATSAVLTTAAGLCLTAWVRGGRTWAGASGALLLGLAGLVRFPNLFLLPMVATAWVSVRRGHRVSWPATAAVVAASVLGTVPLLWTQWSAYGHPFSNGYSYWVPGVDSVTEAFGGQFVGGQVASLMREALQVEWRSTAASWYGANDYVGPAACLLFGLAAVAVCRRPGFRWLVLGLLPGVCLQLTYFFPDPRYFAWLIPFAAIGVGRIATPMPGRPRWCRVAIVLLLVWQALAIPGSGGRASSWVMLAGPSATAAVRWENLSRLAAEAPGVALVTGNPVFAKIGLGPGWTVAPATDEHDYRWNPERFRFGVVERAAWVRAALDAHRAVWLLAEEELPAVASRCSPPAGWQWQPVWATGSGGGAMRLVAR